MKKSLIFLLVSSSLLIGCSGNKKNASSESINLTELDNSSLDNELAETKDSEEDEMLIDDETPFDEQDRFATGLSEEAQIISASSELAQYQIQKNDSLMLVAWKIYGDYSKWRDLEKLNEGKIHDGNLLAGESIAFNRPETEFNWLPDGSPYLVVRGDTLGLVSEKVYKTNKHWKSIWHNNKDLIRDPNLIFAGFTIYYKNLEQVDQREVASVVK